MPSKIPDIPGRLNEDPNIQHFLSERVSSLCGLTSNKFPGSQPVSFTSSSLDLLENMDFWVCEKSDGVRVLVFVVFNQATQQQEVWLVRCSRARNPAELTFRSTVSSASLPFRTCTFPTGRSPINLYMRRCLMERWSLTKIREPGRRHAASPLSTAWCSTERISCSDQ